ncbi:MAG: hypothetical protein K2H28_00720 [Ruminococcus sp.]|nr:hypothetical protein [Ruminococcus sp.]
MKKFIIIMLAIFTLAGCAKNETSTIYENDFSGIQRKTAPSATTSETTTTVLQAKSEISTITIQEINTQDTITAETTEITTTTYPEIQETNTDTTAETVATITETLPVETQPDPLGAGAFAYDEDGAVQFSAETESNDDQTLISAGQALFESACQTEWNFTVGCPYAINDGRVIKNDYDWVYYQITDEKIHTLNDVKNDYYNVFSDRYPHEDLDMLYTERDGNVYAMNGKREMNAYYSMSRITGIESRTNDEIFFTVEHQFEGTDQNPNAPYSENDTFSVVISPDGKWKAGKFRLPY